MSKLIVVGSSGIGAVIAAKLIAELNKGASEVVVVDDISSIDDVENLNNKESSDAADKAKATILDGLRCLTVRSWAVESAARIEPRIYLEPSRQPEIKAVRQNERFQMARKQQSLMAKCRRK